MMETSKEIGLPVSPFFIKYSLKAAAIYLLIVPTKGNVEQSTKSLRLYKDV